MLGVRVIIYKGPWNWNFKILIELCILKILLSRPIKICVQGDHNIKICLNFYLTILVRHNYFI